MTDQPASLAEALARLQARLPRIAKAAEGQAGTRRIMYADLPDVTSALYPVLASLGLFYFAAPTLVVLNGELKFVLDYRIEHAASGEHRGGMYPLGTGNPQQLGSAITYARRYCLLAVTGAAPDDGSDDGGHAASTATGAEPEPLGKPPVRPPDELPRNADGTISRSQATDEELAAAGVMTSQQQREHNKLSKATQEGAVNGVTRAAAADPDDQWLDAPPQPLRAPRAAKDPAQAIAIHFTRLGVTDRDERLKATARLAGVAELATTKDLTAAQGARVKGRLEKCRDRAALIAELAEVVDA